MENVARVGPREKDERARTALASAMRELVEKCGTQAKAGARIGLAQGRVSDVLNGKGAVELETLIALREALRRPIDQILGLPPLEVADDDPRRSLAEVVAMHPNRWPTSLVSSVAARSGIPPRGWRVLLDELLAAINSDNGDDDSRDELEAHVTGRKRR